MDLRDFPTRLYSNQSVQPLNLIKIPVKSHVYENISLPVRHYDFKIKFLRNNHSNVRRIKGLCSSRAIPNARVYH